MKPLVFLVAAAFAVTAHARGGTSVVGSKHDFSVTGPGPIKAQSETQVCVFCHVAHGGTKRKLGARPDVGNSHRPYESTTMRGRASTPSGSTRICLSCHDGTIAVGQTLKRSIPMNLATDAGRIPAGRRSNLGTDLRSTHPVSLPGAASEKAHRPAARDPVALDEAGLVQCTSCHDPHAEFGGSQEGFFLVRPTLHAEICVTCHVVSPGGAHGTSNRTFAPEQGNEQGYASVGAAGCRACHRSHGADPRGRLVARGKSEADDSVCLRCHRGAAARVNVGADLAKPYSHAVDGGNVHDASEGPNTAGHRIPEASAAASRHVVCVDCHEPHEASDVRANAPVAGGPLAGVWGIDAAGRRVERVAFEYEVCFKCHGDSANKASPAAFGVPRRAVEDRNLRHAFDPGAASYHPVVAPARGADVPSLRPPLTMGAQIYCSDCHASDSGPGAGGSGARGPHGSVYASLLERQYTTADPSVESPTAYALCYKCHDRDVLLSGRSAFRLHALHVVDQRTACSTCHASHGVASPQGNPTNNAHLVDFDLRVVRPGPGGRIEYESTGRRTGSCSLTCHATGAVGGRHDRRPY